MLVYESETLGVLSINIESKDENRIHLTVKYHDYEGKILDSAAVVIDCKNNVIWINGERDCWGELRKVIRDNVIIQDKTKSFPTEYLGMKGELEVLVKFYKENFKEEINVKGDFFSWKFPNLSFFFELNEE